MEVREVARALAAAGAPGADSRSRTAVRLLLINDQELIRSAMRLLIEFNLGHEVAEASPEKAIEILTRTDFDLVLLDASSPEEDGLRILEQIHSVRPNVPVLMISICGDHEHVRGALERGVAGFLLTDAAPSQLAEGIETAVSGRGIYLHPRIVERMVATTNGSEHSSRLTQREIDVLTLVTKGATNEEIAATLFLTQKTVKTHLSSIFRKLRVANRTEAAIRAVREGLVSEWSQAEVGDGYLSA